MVCITHQLFTYKFDSSLLKEKRYNIQISFKEARENKCVVALADSQMLRSIRRIRNRDVAFSQIQDLYKERDKLKVQHLKTGDKKLADQIRAYQKDIDDALFVPEYVTVHIEHISHYDEIYQKGVKINGHTYHRFSCSASQARNSTVVLIDDEIADELRKCLNNGRDMNKAIAPSKFNAYFGLSSSSTQVVSSPKFIVVRDFVNETEFMSNYVDENSDWNVDDEVVEKKVKLEMNRSDGMGLISPEQSQKWAQELELDYIPSQWGIRQNFMKGMLCVFPIHQFCEEINGGNYVVDTIYSDADGNPIKADLRDYDVIISESQFKLWDSFPNIETYIKNCEDNGWHWGITQPAPKECPLMLNLNYQFIQTLNLNKDDVEELCSQFVDWLQGVSYDNPWYTMLFLLGVNNDEKKIHNFLRSSNAWWQKSLVLAPHILGDKYVLGRIKELIKRRMEAACLGRVFVDGNFQILVSDPYAFMQHVCGLSTVTGLLGDGEFYSNFWNQRSVRRVDSMRSPLTYRSEHVILNLRNDEETRKWYKHCQSGIIINYFGHEVVNWAGADFDLDQIATTNNPVILRGVYKNELPITYKAAKPEKKVFTDEDLFQSDKFSFGSKIGAITNHGSNGYAILPIVEEKYGINSDEAKLLRSRLRQICKAQAKEIDKAKIGQKVKGIPELWTLYQYLSENDDAETRRSKEINNAALLKKHPYFFIYHPRYKDTKHAYKQRVDETNATCMQRFGLMLDELLHLEKRTEEQQKFIDAYYENLPVTWSDSPSNLLCQYIEGIIKSVLKRVKANGDRFDYEVYKKSGAQYTNDEYNGVKELIKEAKQHWKDTVMVYSIEKEADTSNANTNAEKAETYSRSIGECLDDISGNRYALTNAAIDYFYVENESSNKNLLWEMFGNYIFENVRGNTEHEHSNGILFPMPCPEGDIEYLGRRYKLNGVDMW